MFFKRILSSILCLVMLLGLYIPVSADELNDTGSKNVTVSYGMGESFMVTIPANFAIDSSAKATANISASNIMIGSNKSLKVYISGHDYDDSWQLIDETEPLNTLTYTIGSTEGGNDIVNNSIVLSVAAGEAYNSTVIETLYFTVVDDLTKSGTYSDVLTFTVDVGYPEYLVFFEYPKPVEFIEDTSFGALDLAYYNDSGEPDEYFDIYTDGRKVYITLDSEEWTLSKNVSVSGIALKKLEVSDIILLDSEGEEVILSKDNNLQYSFTPLSAGAYTLRLKMSTTGLINLEFGNFDFSFIIGWDKPCTVTYDGNGGISSISSDNYEGIGLTLPTATHNEDWFIGWYDAAVGGNKIGDAGDSYYPLGDITLYAHWQEPIERTIVYDANGGNCNKTSDVYQGTKIILPEATKKGHEFLGWYTSRDDGTRIGYAGDDYIPSSNITLYARYEEKSYTITYSKTEVESSTGPSKAAYGQEINLSVTYTNGQSSVPTVVGDVSGTSIEITSSGSGKKYTYTFVMPDEAVTVTLTGTTCITADTLITLADGSVKRVDSLTGDEELLIWNHETGELDKASVAYIVDHNGIIDEYEVIHLNFENGKTVKIVGEHVFFDTTLNRYVSINTTNVDSFIGHTFAALNEDNTMLEKVMLVSAEKIIEKTAVYEVVSYKHLTSFTEGILSTSAYLDSLLNVFDIDTANLAYTPELVQRDIETYGLYTYTDFEGLISEEAFELYNAKYLKIAVGKGYIVWDDILDLIDIYFDVDVQPIR